LYQDSRFVKPHHHTTADINFHASYFDIPSISSHNSRDPNTASKVKQSLVKYSFKMAPRSKIIKAEASVVTSTDTDKLLKHKRRYCRTEGCTRIVKSQGLCQRHGAKPRQCRVANCGKQAQGNFDGMCKSHFKADKRETTPLPPKPNPISDPEPPPAAGESVYDRILPASLSWNPVTSAGEMPLIEHFKQGFLLNKPPAWHRNEERRARGLWPVHDAAMQLEGWERELVWMQILLLTGSTPESSFLHLARAWGRDKGFHMVLSEFICERHGNVERKQRDQARGVIKEEQQQQQPDQTLSYQVSNEGDYIGADMLDAVYGDADYNEALAADLMLFDDADDLTPSTGGQHMHARNSSFMSSFTFNVEDGDFGDEFDCSSSTEDFSDESNSHSHDDDEPWPVVAPRLCSPCHSGMHA
jgi:hypothetical protein